jgi:hypothetical protein
MYSDKTAPIDKDLFIQKGTTKTYEIQFQKNGAPIDITGWTIFFTLKEKMSDTDANAIIKKTLNTPFELPNAVEGIALITLLTTDTNIDTKSYYYDITVQNAVAPVSRAVILRGRLTIEKTTTRRETE